MKKKVVTFLKKTRKKVSKYMSTNRLFLSFLILTLFETILIRYFTLGNTWDFEPFICDLAFLIILGSFGYFMKPKKQFSYYFIWLAIVTVMCIVNSIYYVFYTSFASFSLLTELGLVGDVGDSLTEKIRLIDFIYLLAPLLYIMMHTKLKRGSYYHFVAKVENGVKMFGSTLLAGIAVLLLTVVNLSGSDVSTLVKQWNRQYIVQRYGIVLYQGNDLVQSMIPKINSMFGYDEAAKNFKDYYSEKFAQPVNSNKYTGVLEGMNVIFIHMESIHNYLYDMEINGQEITPTLNRLAREGMYFSNFYPQVSIGNSSDTEFTLNTSLMPANIGTAFVQYSDVTYESIPKILSDKGYYTFSAHANKASMWNRAVMHPNLGYQELIFQEKFDYNEETERLGLGLSDEKFFYQLQSKLEKIENEHANYMGTVIQLSNHSPYAATEYHPEIYDSFGKLNLTNTYTIVNDDGEKEVVTDEYLEGTKLGNYLITAHYGDMALGTFIEYVENSEYYNNTVFVLYGDHDARLSKSEYRYYYNYNIETGEVYEEEDPEYVDYNNFTHEVNKRTPLIIWTKNKRVARKIKMTNNNVMGMYDILPTLGNMMNFEYKYALGHDIYDIKENNVVVFPNGNFVTNKVYYNNTKGNYMILNSDSNDIGVIIDEDYISDLKLHVDEILGVSNDILVHDLILKEEKNIPVLEGSEVTNG